MQLRAKQLDDDAFVMLARALKDACDETGVPLVLNDRAWLATLVGAAAVHVGQTDMPVETVRDLAGPKVRVGLLVNFNVQLLPQGIRRVVL